MKEYNLTGEYKCKLDAKGRIKLPVSLIRQFGFDGVLELTINRGFEKNLMMYPREVWEEKTEKINQLNMYITKERAAKRYFYRGATKVVMDSADRILVPATLLEYADLKDEVVLLAYHEQVEIWSGKAYKEMISNEPESFDVIANEIFGGKQSSEDGERPSFNE